MKRIINGIVFSFIILSSAYPQGKDQPDTLIRLNGVEIKDFLRKDKPYHMDCLDQREIELSAARDIGDVLRKVPNVSGIRKGGTCLDPVVRGFKFNQLNVRINDGMKIEGGCPNRMDPTVSHIDVDDINKIEVIKGPFALRYGPNLGGIINIKTIQPLPQDSFKIHLKAMQGYESNWNGNKEHLAIYGGNKRIYFLLSGNHKKYNDYKDGNGEVVSSAFTKYNYNAQLGASPFNGHHVILFYDESHGRNVMYPALPMDERIDDTRLMSLDYKISKISDVINDFHFKIYQSNVLHEMDNKERPFSDTVVAVSRINAINFGYRIETHLKFGKNSIWIGTDHESISKDGDRTKTRILEPTMPVMKEKLWNNAKITNYGIFSEFSRSFNKLNLITAVRLDINSATSGDLLLKKKENIIYSNDSVDSDHVNFSFSIGGIYSINKKLSLSLALGRGARSPDMVERFIILLPIGYDNYDYLGNPQLDPEINYEADLSAEYVSHSAGVFDAGIFYSYVLNYITGRHVPSSEVKPQSKDVVGVKQFYNEDYVHLMGFEFLYRSPASYRWGVHATASYTAGVNPSTTKYIIENKQVVDEEEVKNDPLSEIPPLEGNISFLYKFFENRLVPGFSVRLVAPQNKISEAYDESQTSGFVTAGFFISYKFHKYVNINGGVNNIFDKAYYEHLSRRIIGSRKNMYEPGRVFYINLIFKI
jgi:iron complex outermembrane receptor protein